jgi:glycosyltransferase involved in cell wall biosynthesis
MIAKKRLLIFYDWFYPGFKAGGPIQSLTNLAIALLPEFEIYIITGSCDLNSDIPYNNVGINRWNDIRLSKNADAVKVFYSGRKTLDKQKIISLINEINPSVVYLNGIFSYVYFLLPLIALKKLDRAIKIVICPRGMLKKGALSGKAFKKKIYIKYLKLLGLLAKSYWHATSEEEMLDINAHFSFNKGVVIADNIPREPLHNISPIIKQTGELKLIYLSLINEHKNLLLLLQLIKELKADILLDVYGPVVDKEYGRKCMEMIKQLPDKVQYKGSLQPALVHDLIQKYHAFILLTKGENFGHAIFESLGAGRPVITSHFTPWQNLYENVAGVNVSLESEDDCYDKIKKFIQMPQEEYDAFCNGAQRLAKNYYKNLDPTKAYKQVFS